MAELTRDIMSIHDDGAGEGPSLAFPTMSSCSACICVLDDRLVGVHKTQGSDTIHLKLFAYAKQLIGTAKVHGLYVAGWNAGTDQHHDLNEIARGLGLAGARRAPIFCADYNNSSYTTPRGRKAMAFKPGTFNRKMTDLCTFAFRNGTGAPTVGVKRMTKVTVHDLDQYASQRKEDRVRLGMGVRESLMLSYPERINTPSSHLHGIAFQSFM